MTQDDAAARKARAAKLRSQIRKLTQADEESEESEESEPDEECEPGDTGSADSDATGTKESPREFIQRRMRQIDKKKKKDLG